MMKAKWGFTMVETLVVITILLVLSGIGLQYVKNFGVKQDVNSVHSQLLSSLRLARNLAISQQKSQGMSQELVRVTIMIDDKGGVTVFPNDEESYPYFGKTSELKSISVSKSNGSDGIYFSAYEGKLVDLFGRPLGLGESIAVTVASLEDSSQSRKIVINSSGSINEK